MKRNRAPKPDTLKCLVNNEGDKVIRVRNAAATELVASGEWWYCAKSLFKSFRGQK